MLNTRDYSVDSRIVIIMSEIAVQAAIAKVKLEELAKQASTLALGLQNAAPGEKDKPNVSIQYLITISEALNSLAEECDEVEKPTVISPKDDSG